MQQLFLVLGITWNHLRNTLKRPTKTLQLCFEMCWCRENQRGLLWRLFWCNRLWLWIERLELSQFYMSDRHIGLDSLSPYNSVFSFSRARNVTWMCIYFCENDLWSLVLRRKAYHEFYVCPVFSSFSFKCRAENDGLQRIVAFNSKNEVSVLLTASITMIESPVFRINQKEIMQSSDLFSVFCLCECNQLYNKKYFHKTNTSRFQQSTECQGHSWREKCRAFVTRTALPAAKECERMRLWTSGWPSRVILFLPQYDTVLPLSPWTIPPNGLPCRSENAPRFLKTISENGVKKGARRLMLREAGPQPRCVCGGGGFFHNDTHMTSTARPLSQTGQQTREIRTSPLPRSFFHFLSHFRSSLLCSGRDSDAVLSAS